MPPCIRPAAVSNVVARYTMRKRPLSISIPRGTRGIVSDVAKAVTLSPLSRRKRTWIFRKQCAIWRAK